MGHELTEAEKATNYETLLHINQVRWLLQGVWQNLLLRGQGHDASKLVDPELSSFVEMTPEKSDALLDAMRRAVSFIRLNERRPNNSFYLAEPERAYGMVRGSCFDDEVTLDTTCGVIEALLWLDRVEKTRADK